ncbi:MAG: Holliday junction resolvase RuvX [Gemmatimonadales bacterium]|nr:Holliday junction resolvase RuvX [Gemmatimonadales bacterium]
MTDPGKSLLGLDYGLKRIGVAVGDVERSLAFALGTHEEGKDGSIFDFLSNLIGERDIGGIVVGLPVTASGEEKESADQARRFARRLEEEFRLPVVLWDERYSSQEADRWLRNQRRREKKDRDSLAAEIILQSYLDSLAAADRESERGP